MKFSEITWEKLDAKYGYGTEKWFKISKYLTDRNSRNEAKKFFENSFNENNRKRMQEYKYVAQPVKIYGTKSYIDKIIQN